MNCAAVAKALAFEDVTLAIDPIAMREHLRACSACRAAHGDLVALFGIAAAPVRRDSHGTLRIAAAAALLWCAGALIHVDAPPRASAPDTPRTAALRPRAPGITNASPLARPRSVERVDALTHEVVAFAHGRERSLEKVTRTIVRARSASR
ncbi:MAG: hypothetical protein IPH13_02075 [Planctomycetes bacterium]|nr:hypothetical protein [Planctomycetota bacterium]MCC7173101.1 hypothetical protein [Planctomycetota bacterium]